MLIILAIGLGLIAYGIFTLSVRVKYIPMSKIITGTVIDLHKAITRRGGAAYFPVIEYYNTEINSVESFEHEAANGRSKYNIGDILELRYYCDENRKLVLINTWSGIWLTPIVFIIAGVIFTAFGLLMKLV